MQKLQNMCFFTVMNGGIRGKLFEMDRTMNTALCCAGGGGNFFTDILGTGTDLSSRVRAREALETGAEIIAVACPQCYKMLDDAVKDEGVQENIRGADIASILPETGTNSGPV